MRIRFLKNNEYIGIKTAIVDGKATIEDCRFFVEFGQILEIQYYILAPEGGIDIITSDNSIFHVGPDDIELSEPSSYVPTGQCCNKKI
jgi:hypothetical protein